MANSCMREPVTISPRIDRRLLLQMNRYNPGFGSVRYGNVWKTFQKLRRLSGFRDINIYQLFAPIDPNGRGRVLRSAFVGALMGRIGYHACISRLEMEQLAHFYTDRATNTVDYRAFAEFINGDERRGFPGQPIEFESGAGENRLVRTAADKVELAAVKNILDRIACVMMFYRIHIDAYIREYEAQTHMIGLVSIPQLDRVLTKMGIFLTDQDFGLLCKWFGRYGYFIDSRDLTRELRSSTTSASARGIYDPAQIARYHGQRRLDSAFPKRILASDPGPSTSTAPFGQAIGVHASQDRWNYMREDFVTLIQRIQRAVYSLKIRVRPHFQQFDPLNSGRCSIVQFLRGLDMCGVNRNGDAKIFISPRELQDLLEFYSDTQRRDTILWRAFVNDIETVHCIREVNRRPSANIRDYGPQGPPRDVAFLPCKYAGRMSMTVKEHRWAERVMEYVRNQAAGCNLYQFFINFDRRNSGHVSRNQFRIVMRMGKVYLRTQDVLDIERFFFDYNGFCYMFFLQLMGEIEPPTEYVYRPPRPTTSTLHRDSGYAEYETEGRTIEQVMRKIRDTVYRRNMRLEDWFLTHDKFRSGTLSRDLFVRALSSAHNWAFTYREYSLLMNMFAKPSSQDDIDYRAFVSAVHEVYTQGNLERTPLIVPVPFQGCREITKFSKEELTHLGNCMRKIVRQGVNIADIATFQNFDRLRRNTVNFQQYQQAMDSLGALIVLTEYERKLVFRAFCRDVHRWFEFDYREFLKACNHVYRPRIEERM